MPAVDRAASGRLWRGREWTIATLSLFALLAIAALFAFLLVRDRDEVRNAAAVRAQEQALTLSEQAARLVEGAELSLTAVIEDALPWGWERMQSSRTLWQHINRGARHLPYVEAYWLCSADGRLRLTSLAFPAPHLDCSRYPFFNRLRDGEGTVVGDLVEGAGRPTFRLSRRLESPSGGFAGTASVTIEAGYFQRLYQSLPLPTGSPVMLLRAADLAVMVAATAATGAEPPPSDQARLRHVLAAHPDGAIYTDGDTLMAVRAVPGVPLYVQVGIPVASLHDVWVGRAALRGVTASLSVAALSLLSWAAFEQARRQRVFQDELAARVAERTRALETAKAQLETVVQELHHRVNNNLQIIASLLEMQAARIRTPETRAALAPSIGRVHAIGLVHRTLYGTGELVALRFGDYLTALAGHAAELYGTPAGAVRVTGANPSFPLEVAVPLALIVHEILANALVHAYPGAPHTGPAEIVIREEPDHWLLTISDHGIGLPANFDWTRSHGLGLTIVRSLAAQLGCDIELNSSGGTRFLLRLPRQMVKSG